MNIIWEELTAGLPDMIELERVVLRLVVAMLLGAVIGLNRERIGKPAGLRTHMLVSLGAALFVLTCSGTEQDKEGITRVIQGVATGIGFIGAGAILKVNERNEIKGLTTAAGLWLTAAVGVAAGLGRIGAAVLSVILALITLTLVASIENYIEKRWSLNPDAPQTSEGE